MLEHEPTRHGDHRHTESHVPEDRLPVLTALEPMNSGPEAVHLDLHDGLPVTPAHRDLRRCETGRAAVEKHLGARRIRRHRNPLHGAVRHRGTTSRRQDGGGRRESQEGPHGCLCISEDDPGSHHAGQDVDRDGVGHPAVDFRWEDDARVRDETSDPEPAVSVAAHVIPEGCRSPASCDLGWLVERRRSPASMVIVSK